jgi:hypothetical protein
MEPMLGENEEVTVREVLIGSGLTEKEVKVVLDPAKVGVESLEDLKLLSVGILREDVGVGSIRAIKVWGVLKSSGYVEQEETTQATWKVPKETPWFEGASHHHPERYVEAMEKELRTNGVPEAAFQMILAGRIKETVLQAKQIEAKVRAAISYEEAKAVFVKEARMISEEKKARRWLQGVSSDSYPALDKFIEAIRAQVKKLAVNEPDVVDAVAERLETNLQAAFKVVVNVQQIDDIDQALVALQELASDDRRSGKGTQRRGGIDNKGRRGGEQRRCHNCQKVGHIAKDCRSKPENENKNKDKKGKKDKKDVSCFKCQVKGHYARDCPGRPGADAEFGWIDHVADADLFDADF